MCLLEHLAMLFCEVPIQDFKMSLRAFSLSYLWESFTYSGTTPLSDIDNIFSHSLACIFTPLMVSFDKEKFLILMKFSVSIFFLVLSAQFYVLFKKTLPTPRS